MLDPALSDDLRTSFMPQMPGNDEQSGRLRAEVWRDPRTVIGASDAGADSVIAIPSALVRGSRRSLGACGMKIARIWPVVAMLTVATCVSAIDRPLHGGLVRIHDPGAPSQRHFFFRSVKQATIAAGTIPDPTVDGATLEINGSGGGDGNTGVLVLPAENWTALSNGFYYRDRAASVGGISQVRIRPRSSIGGALHISARGPSWSFLLVQPQADLRLRLTIGSDVFCARFTDLQPNQAGRLQGKNNPAPLDCN